MRSAPTAMMNGLPVTPKPTISPFAARSAAASTAFSSSARPCGPKLFGFVWSKPLSRVTSTKVPALLPPVDGSVMSWLRACVTTSARAFSALD